MCGCSCSDHSTKDTAATAGATVFTVPDMTCGHCEKSLRSAFEAAMPDAALSFDLPNHKLSVTGDAARASAVIAEAGFTVEPA
ncbi:MAG: heavy-metal-associated domain-containing protein [Paracoccus sp. (in: a-proteobacteria)]